MVFFSGTDWSELEDNAPNHNFYLSLIVNNFMDFCAKVCFIAEANETQDFSFVAKDENGNPFVYVSSPYEVKQKKLVVYDCDIKSPISTVTTEDAFKSRVAGIIKDEADKAAKLAAQRTVVTGPGWTAPTHLKSLGRTTSQILDSTGKGITPGGIGSKRGAPITDYKGKQESFKRWDSMIDTTPPKVEVPLLMTAQDLEDMITDFSMYVMVTGNELEVFADLEDICEHYEKYQIPHANICETIMKKYVECYESFFAGMEDHLDMESFISNTELLIDEYKHEAKMSDTDSVAGLLTKLAVSLELMVRDLAA